MSTSTPRPILLATLIVSGACVLSALAGEFLAVSALARGGREVQLYFLAGFGILALLAAGMGVLAGLGRFAAAPALAILCVGGTLFTVGVLAEPDLVLRLVKGGAPAPVVVSGVNIVPFVIAQIAAGVFLAILAALIVLLRDPQRSFRYLVRAMVFAIPVAAALALVVVPSLRQKVVNLNAIAGFALAVGGFFVFGGFLTASLHCLIRAFEVGIERAENANPRSSPGA